MLSYRIGAPGLKYKRLNRESGRQPVPYRQKIRQLPHRGANPQHPTHPQVALPIFLPARPVVLSYEPALEKVETQNKKCLLARHVRLILGVLSATNVPRNATGAMILYRLALELDIVIALYCRTALASNSRDVTTIMVVVVVVVKIRFLVAVIQV